MTLKRNLVCASILVLAANGQAWAQAVEAEATTVWPTGYSAQWFTQIGVTSGIETQANGGAGFKLGFVDTGIAPTQMDVTGRVSTLSKCAAVSFRCSNGYIDDNGHGTATAAIGAGATSGGAGMAGVAPRATIIAEKVLKASGSGYDTDVANGIVAAVNAGAQVVNLSLTYLPTPSVITAINYAASKGTIIVFAGGNSSLALNGGANSTGFTQDALNRLVFVGSVNSANVLSSFSNTPGAGAAIAGSARSSYASLWLMAPGERIIAPGIQYGSTAFAYWSGTSMAAPVVSGALALLESTWPVLQRNGTATRVLFQSSTDLGANGIDNVYGNGLLNVSRAFQPIGAMTVTTASGGSIAVSSLTATTLTSGALGSLSVITPLLANYTSFDSFQRNFTVDLSGLLKQSGSKATGTSSLSSALLSSSTRLTNGGTLAFSMGADRIVPHGINPGADNLSNAVSDNARGLPTGAWVASLSDPSGVNIAVGHGFPVATSFAEAMWGQDALAVSASYSLEGVTDLSSLAGGGHFMALGMDTGEHTRVGLSITETGAPDYSVPSARRLMPHASAVSAGVTTQLASGWTAGMTMSFLGEENGLLGAQYTSGGAFSLGREHRSMSAGLSLAVKLGEGTGLLFNAVLARTQGARGEGLIADTTPLLARSYGMALVQQNLFGANDHASFSVTKPLRVFDGSIDLVTTSVDGEGYAHTGLTRTGLHPSGNETDFATGYAKFWGNTNVSASLNVRQDANNLKGVTDIQLRLGTGLRF